MTLLRISLLLSLLQLPIWVSGSVIYVPADSPTIQSAVSTASLHDTVLVASGDYYENVSISNVPLTLASTWILTGDTTAIAGTRIHGDSLANNRRPLMIGTGSEDTVYIAGLTLLDGTILDTQHGAGLYVISSNVRMDHCVLRNNTSNSAAGAYFAHSTIRIDSCLFQENAAIGGGGAVFGYESSLQLTGSRFVENSSFSNSACLLWNHVVGKGLITENIFENNTSGGYYGTCELFSQQVQDGTWLVANNVFQENTSEYGGGLKCYNLDSLVVHGNSFINNHAELDTSLDSGEGGALALFATQYVEILGNLFQDNVAENLGGAILMGSHGSIHHNQFIHNLAGDLPVMFTITANNLVPTIHFYKNLVTQNGVDPESSYPYPFYGGLVSTFQGSLDVTQNDFIDNQGLVIQNAAQSTTTAIRNYWGDPTGPYQPVDNTDGLGDTLALDIPYRPYSTRHFFAPRLDLPEAGHHFWRVPVDSEAQWNMLLTNGGVQPLTLQLQMNEGRDFILRGPTTRTLDEADTLLVPVIYHPTDEGPHTDTLRIGTNDPDTPLRKVPLIGETALSVPRSEAPTLPHVFSVSPAYPNPFNAETRWTVRLPHATELRITLYDVLGREVKELLHRNVDAGTLPVAFSDPTLPSGTYFLTVQTSGGKKATQRLVLLR